MEKFTKEMVNDYAGRLLIGLSEEENKMVLDEFEVIDKSIDVINKIPNIDKVEPYSWCLERTIDDLREDEVEESIPIKDALRNSGNHTEVEIEITKVVTDSE